MLRRRAGSAVWCGLLCAILVAAAACEAKDPAQAKAEFFVDRYYVEIDLEEALVHTAGLAREKIVREQELLKGIGPPDLTGKPSVHYRFVEESEPHGAARRSFLYELTISFRDGQVVRQALVTLQQDAAGTWQVANFREVN